MNIDKKQDALIKNFQNAVALHILEVECELLDDELDGFREFSGSFRADPKAFCCEYVSSIEGYLKKNKSGGVVLGTMQKDGCFYSTVFNVADCTIGVSGGPLLFSLNNLEVFGDLNIPRYMEDGVWAE